MRFACVVALALLGLGCRQSEPARDDVAEFTGCAVGAADRFVITRDSVGPFAIEGTTMGDVLDSCGAADTAYVDRCCYMSMIARVPYPGVMLEAEQRIDSGHKLILLSEVKQWELTGDSIYLADAHRLPLTLAELASLGQGYAVNPTHDDNDGPQAFVCSMPHVVFRLGMGRPDSSQAWLIDTSAFNRRIRIAGVSVRASSPAGRSCSKVIDTLQRRRGGATR